MLVEILSRLVRVPLELHTLKYSSARAAPVVTLRVRLTARIWTPRTLPSNGGRAADRRNRLLGRLALLPFNDVVDLEDCWLRLDTRVLQDRHELRAEGVKFGLTLEDVYHL